MIIYNKFTVVPLTTHINFKKSTKIIKKNLIITKLEHWISYRRQS